ncbi:MAG: glycosyltransferase family 4 protein [Bacteroides sp.]|nr:glycosyltransferase family 4 protein [Bacteroides sp.]
MRIACIAYLHGFGGAERQIIILANQMVNRGHEVHLIILAEEKLCYELDQRVVKHSLVKAEHGNYLTRILSRRKALIRKLYELGCNIVINFNFQSAYFSAFSNKKKTGKILYSERGDPGDKEYGGIMGILRKLTLPRIDTFVFQSNGARDYFNDRYVTKHSIVIPNACFIEKQKPYEGLRDRRIVTVGRLSHQKNQKILIEAFSKIAHKYKDYSLELYGDGELKDELYALCHKLGLSKAVHFMGTVSDIGEKIKSASLFVLSSDYEGIPNALIEAMALGLPCISTDCKPGGARLLITNGKNGIITPIGSAEALSEAIDQVLSNPKLAKKISISAMHITEKLSPTNIYDQWENVLRKTCEK